MVTYLDDNETLTPVRLEIIHQHTWQYLVFWGLSGVAMGNMLPWFDVLFEAPAAVNWAWDQKQLGMNGTELDRRRESLRRESLRRDSVRRDSVVDSVNREKEVETVWLPAVRGIGVFIGIAFAIVSCLQVWYWGWTNCISSENCHGNLLLRQSLHSSLSIRSCGTLLTAHGPAL